MRLFLGCCYRCDCESDIPVVQSMNNEITFIVELVMLVPPTKALNNEITFIVELVMLVPPNKSLNNETKF